MRAASTDASDAEFGGLPTIEYLVGQSIGLASPHDILQRRGSLYGGSTHGGSAERNNWTTDRQRVPAFDERALLFFAAL